MGYLRPHVIRGSVSRRSSVRVAGVYALGVDRLFYTSPTSGVRAYGIPTAAAPLTARPTVC